MHSWADEAAVMAQRPKVFGSSNGAIRVFLINRVEGDQIVAGVKIGISGLPAIPELPSGGVAVYEIVVDDFGKEQCAVHGGDAAGFAFAVAVGEHRVFGLPEGDAVFGGGVGYMATDGNARTVAFVGEVAVAADEARQVFQVG